MPIQRYSDDTGMAEGRCYSSDPKCKHLLRHDVTCRLSLQATEQVTHDVLTDQDASGNWSCEATTSPPVSHQSGLIVTCAARYVYAREYTSVIASSSL